MKQSSTITRRALLASAAAALPVAARGKNGDWIPLFNGKSLKGWKAGESSSSWKVRDGLLTADGPRSHLFYAGPVNAGTFRNFELKAKVMTRRLCNSGLYFHTKFQESGFPHEGFEVQINNTATGENGYLERKKTASLYAVRNVYKQLAADDAWFELHIIVQGKRVQIFLNGIQTVDFVEPTPAILDANGRGRTLSQGTFALQCHDPGSKVFFKSIEVKPLPDEAPAPPYTPVADDTYRTLLALGADNYPVVDYHAHLKAGWTLEEALRNSREVGIAYGIAVNCGLNFPTQNDAGIEEFLGTMRGQPCFAAMQAEGREWVTMFSPAAIAKFDYVFTDSMTFSHQGRRIRLWMPNEVPPVDDQERFMDVIVEKTVGILSREPVDIYVNPTFLPDVMARNYDKLWTASRMNRVIEAAVANGVAIEINNRYRLPSPAIIKAAKAAGAKFSFGTNNSDRNIGRLEYPIQMVKECGLRWQDIFVPKPDGEKPIQKRGLPKST
jgi:hypothetical protein